MSHGSWVAIALLVFATVRGVAADETAEVLFVRRIAPLLQAKCLACHGAEANNIQGGFDLRTSFAVAKGGDSGESAIVVGKPEKSPLYLAVTRTEDTWSAMPPKEADRLSAEQVEWIKTWIAGGAPWPSDARRQEIVTAHREAWSAEDGVPVRTSGGLSAAWTERKYRREGLWAYQPVRRPVINATGATAIDALIAQRLPPDLSVAPQADARTLIRRVTFALTGLPPTPREIHAYVAESKLDAEAAWAALIERLLASPHYGERMAQHWLDVVRYADSSGFANDYERGNAWRYRDYVVRSFNSDKPYDQFIREQIAGDELDPDDPEKIIATGFLRMGPWELTGMEVAKVARQRFLDDVVNSVGETFLAQALQCARCHDHKFDPVPTRDYYTIQAVFATTQLAERPAAFLPTENTAGFDEKRFLEQRREAHLAALQQLDEILLANAERWFAEHGKDRMKWDAAVVRARGRDTGGVFNAARNDLTRQNIPEDEFPPKLFGFTPEQFGLERVARKGLERLRWELERYEPFALAVYDGRTPDVKSIAAPTRPAPQRMTQGELEVTCVLTGGDPFSPAEKVSPGVLSVIGGELRPVIPGDIVGRRRAFAEWIARADNPLTTRAIVNRVWMWHFGEALAGNPNNFGSTGKLPTHPELLDWLAADFVEQGWSFKALHRQILLSAAYRRSAEHPHRELLAEKDPTGISYAVFKPRRLTAEELRDAMLAATGELNPTLGGIPNRPELNLEAALQPRQVMGTFAAAWTPNAQPSERHRRSLYALKLRGLVDPAMEVFNAPAPDFSCERRETSTVTPQVFALFNSHASTSRAVALAVRVLKETKNDSDAITRCFELTFGRLPRPVELQACLQHWRAMESVQANARLVRPSQPLSVRREAVEENTGEKFRFEESLAVYQEYVPDLHPLDIDIRTRALADVCLVLFNANEFAYVY